MRKIHPSKQKVPRMKSEAQRDREAKVVEKRRAKYDALLSESPYLDGVLNMPSVSHE